MVHILLNTTKQIIIEEIFLNLGWICIEKIDKQDLLQTLELKIDTTTNWKDGIALVNDSFDEKVFLSYKIENWSFLISKYYFSDHQTLKDTLIKLSQKSTKVYAFAIDVWSNYYCHSKSMDGKIIRFWSENDESVINEGQITNIESEITEKETANKILELASKTTIEFKQMENYINTQKINILK